MSAGDVMSLWPALRLLTSCSRCSLGGVGGDDGVAVRQEAADEDGADAASGTADDDYPILFHVYSLH